MIHADLIIIGAGPGGYETAISAAKKGLQVILIEAQKTGGTCLNEGCIPTKCLHKNAEFLLELGYADKLGVTVSASHPDIHQVMNRKNEIVSTLSQGVKTLINIPGLNLVRGKAYFVDKHVVGIENTTEQYTAENIIIATGSITRILQIKGIDLPGVLTSTSILNIDYIPQSLCVIGGGVIGLEFASNFSALGSHVTVIEFCKEILPNLDSEIAKRLRMTLKQRGINVITQAGVTSLSQEEGGLSVSYECKGKTLQCLAQNVLCAIGRQANVKALNLSDIGIEYNEKGITVDEHLQTNVKGVFAIGDINGKCQLAHAAVAQGTVVLDYLLNQKTTVRLDLMPSVVFTIPEVASIGMSEDLCKKNNLSYNIHKSFYRANGKALAMNATDGIVKIISDSATGKILGCHMYGAHASDIIQEIVSLMYFSGTINDLRSIIHSHPTLSETILEAVK